MFHDESYFEAMKISYFSSYCSPRILASIDDSYLKQLLLRSLMNFVSPSLHPPIMLSLLLHLCSIIYFYEHEPTDIYYIISVQSTIGLELAGGIFFKLVPLPPSTWSHQFFSTFLLWGTAWFQAHLLLALLWPLN